ncbi:universal stress protein [Fulvivirga lutea]|uniref:Universal stress protein n=1 Tax=Fulvivirga lutea TaxID=2810512 RepID=A0A974WF91_9BACT|nr:universal stress protein [Fulvivirga lutea]QSE97126.1 universal stress protein [Fulvivirga lutea]
MQKILVPTDFSELSESALKLAVDIGRRADAEVYLVNFMDHPFGPTFSTTGEIDAGGSENDLYTLKLARKNHQRLAEIASRHGVSVKVNYQVYDEDFEDGFKKYIREQAIDLAVIATSGEESADEFFSGNHTEQMIVGASCPVISVKGDYNDNDFKKIVVGIDLEHDDEDNFLQAAKFLNSFAKNVSGKLHLVHVADLDSDKAAIEKKVKSFVDKYKFENYTLKVTQNDDKEQGLIAYCLGTGASMLALLTHASGGLLSIFTESTTEELSKRSSIPVMAINLHNI